MLCPYCHVPMIHGYLHTGMTLWSEKKHSLSLITSEGERYALQLGRPLTHPHQIESDYCPVCHRIILDSSPYPCCEEFQKP